MRKIFLGVVICICLLLVTGCLNKKKVESNVNFIYMIRSISDDKAECYYSSDKNVIDEVYYKISNMKLKKRKEDPLNFDQEYIILSLHEENNDEQNDYLFFDGYYVDDVSGEVYENNLYKTLLNIKMESVDCAITSDETDNSVTE